MKNTSAHILILILLFAVFFFSPNKLFAQAHDPGRGLYVDGFASTDDNTVTGNLVPAFSILGQTAKEDSLLKYCSENHITYIILYNLARVLDNDTIVSSKETALCNFMRKAKNAYGITKIGAIIGSVNGVDRVYNFQQRQMTPTLAYEFTNEEKASSSYRKLQFVETTYVPGDSLFDLSEVTKAALNISRFNKLIPTCSSPDTVRFDVINIELEFWNNSALADFPSQPDLPSLYRNVEQPILDKMALLRYMNDSISPYSPIKTEIYLGYLNKTVSATDSTLTDSVIVSYLDGQLYSDSDTVKVGTANHRLLDKFLLAYYSTDPNTTYSRSNYFSRLHTFDRTYTMPQSNTIPLLSAATIDLGYDGDFFGVWFPKSNRNNIFEAEKQWYTDWLADTHPAIPRKNYTEPGQSVWFTASIMTTERDNPSKNRHTNTFYSNSPINTYGASFATATFNYSGPIEDSIVVNFKLDSAGTEIYNLDTITKSSFTTIQSLSLGSMNLKPFTYTGIITLNYANGQTYKYHEPVIVSNGLKIQAMGPTTFCDGGAGVILKSGKINGSNTVMRYHWFKDSIPLYNDSLLAYYFATQAGIYYCRVDSTNTPGTHFAFSNSITVTVLANNPVVIAESNFTFGPARTLTANGTHVTGTTYAWSNGETTRAINISSFDKYEVIVTQPSGCISTTSLNISDIQCVGSAKYDYEIKSTNSHATNFTGSGFSSADSVSVHVDFHINKNFAFHGAKIWLDPGVRIIVDSSKTLTIDSAAILTACNYMWRGIEVKNSATLNISGSAKINEAETGVMVDSGGVTHVLNSFFDNNYKSITFDSDNFNSSSVIGCNFSCSSGYGLKEPYKYLRSSAHIELNYVAQSFSAQGITIGSVSGGPNYFSGSDFGVLYISSSIKVYNCVFNNYSPNTVIPTFKGVAISGEWLDRPAKPVDLAKNIIGGTATNQRNYFNNCENGIVMFLADFKISSNTFSATKKSIYSNAVLRSSQMEVDNNTIQNTNIGIDIVASGSPNINIHDNPTISVNAASGSTTLTAGIRVAKSFTSSAKAVIENNPSISGLPTYGILVSGFDTSKISNNKVYMNHAGLTTEVFGIRVENCKGPIVNCNYVRGDSSVHIANKNGISITMSQHSFVDNNTTRNTNKGFEFLGDCDLSTIRGNTMKFHKFGFVLGDSLNVTSWSSGIIGDQDTLNGLTLGNRFEGQDSAGAFTNGKAMLSINSNAAAKRFWVHNSYFPPLSFDTLRVGSYSGPLTKFLPHDPGFSHYTIPSACVFANRPTKGGGGILEECCIEELPEEDPEEIVRDSRSRGAYEDILEEESSLTGPEQAFSDSISSTNAGALTEVEIILKAADKKLHEGDNVEYLVKLAEAASRNSDISNSTAYEENEKILNSILIDKKDGTSSDFTESERNSIESIAFQCPYRGGKAVFKARPLVYTWNREIKFDDNILCEDNSSLRKAAPKSRAEKVISDNNIKFYPIPSKGELYAGYNLSLYQNARIVVTNLLGEVVFSQTLNCKSNSAKLNLSLLEPSIYFVKVIADEKPIDQAKITIIK